MVVEVGLTKGLLKTFRDSMLANDK